MKNKQYYFLITLLVTAFLIMACQNENPVSTTEGVLNLKTLDADNDLSPGQLSEEEEEGLIHMRQEEKVARDVYIFFRDIYNRQVFVSIVGSEQKHMDAVKRLLDKYGVEDPILDDTPGEFANSEFQTLYDEYIVQGKDKYSKALEVGKTIEELDISDLQFQLTFVDNKDIINVYNSLLNASYRHLAVFINHINIASTQPPVE